jgi:hypothetical protein
MRVAAQVEALQYQVDQFRKLQAMAMFVGNAVFFKCWIRICYYSGARVQLKRKMAPYLKRPLYYGFDALLWNKAEEIRKRKQQKAAMNAFYGVSTAKYFALWREILNVKANATAHAQKVLQNFVKMFGLSRRGDAFVGWRTWQRYSRPPLSRPRPPVPPPVSPNPHPLPFPFPFPFPSPQVPHLLRKLRSLNRGAGGSWHWQTGGKAALTRAAPSQQPEEGADLFARAHQGAQVARLARALARCPPCL